FRAVGQLEVLEPPAPLGDGVAYVQRSDLVGRVRRREPVSEGDALIGVAAWVEETVDGFLVDRRRIVGPTLSLVPTERAAIHVPAASRPEGLAAVEACCH